MIVLGIVIALFIFYICSLIGTSIGNNVYDKYKNNKYKSK